MTERPSTTTAYTQGDQVKTTWTLGRTIRNAVGEAAWRLQTMKISTMARTALGLMLLGVIAFGASRYGLDFLLVWFGSMGVMGGVFGLAFAASGIMDK
jgi:hypothetical protein